jgi:hypothetical protein
MIHNVVIEDLMKQPFAFMRGFGVDVITSWIYAAYSNVRMLMTLFIKTRYIRTLSKTDVVLDVVGANHISALPSRST